MLSDFVKYVKQYWHDRPDKSTPLNADRLNHIENGIASNSEAINQIANAVVSNIVNDPEKIASMAAVYALQEKLGTGELPSDAPNAISAINTLYSNIGKTKMIQSTSLSDFDSKVTMDGLHIVYGMIDNTGYISFDINWIRLQFKISLNKVQYRLRYGDSSFTAWTTFSA